MLGNWQLRKSTIAREDFGGGGLVQLNPLGRLLRELQGQLKSRLDWYYLSATYRASKAVVGALRG